MVLCVECFVCVRLTDARLVAMLCCRLSRSVVLSRTTSGGYFERAKELASCVAVVCVCVCLYQSVCLCVCVCAGVCVPSSSFHFCVSYKAVCVSVCVCVFV